MWRGRRHRRSRQRFPAAVVLPSALARPGGMLLVSCRAPAHRTGQGQGVTTPKGQFHTCIMGPVALGTLTLVGTAES